jgi:hypothetical protein
MDEPGPCATCGATRQIVWSPAFGEWLCPSHLWARTDQALRQPVTVLPVKP